MELTFELTGDDLWSLHRYVLLRGPQFRRLRPLLLLPFLGVALGGLAGGVRLVSALTSLMLLALLIWLFPRLLKRQAIAQASKQPGVLGEHTLRIDEAGVHSRTALHEGSVAWSGITAVVEERDHVFLFTGPQMAYIIPKRTAGAEQFLQHVQAYRAGEPVTP